MEHCENNFIDIHNHLLPVQDGPASISESVEALETAVENGIKAIILTPHYYTNDKSYFQEFIIQAFEALKEQVEEKGLKIKLYIGNEISVDNDTLHLVKSEKVFTLAKTNYVLLEYPFFQVPFCFEQVINELIEQGYKPVIAHPERNIEDKMILQKMLRYKNLGCMIQINSPSILGLYGRKIQKNAKILIKNEIADIISSDSHGNSFNNPGTLLSSYKSLKNRIEKNYLENIFFNIPERIVEGD